MSCHCMEIWEAWLVAFGPETAMLFFFFGFFWRGVKDRWDKKYRAEMTGGDNG